MMTYNPEDTLRVLKQHLEQMQPRRFVSVRIGSAPLAVLPAGFNAVLTVGDGGPSGESTLQAPIELWNLRILIYRAQAEAKDEDDALLRFRIPGEVEALIRADFTLGGTVRNASFGEYGVQVRATFGEETIATRRYWTAHMDVPVIVDATAVGFAA